MMDIAFWCCWIALLIACSLMIKRSIEKKNLETELKEEMYRHARYALGMERKWKKVKAERDAALDTLKISGGCGNCVHCKTDFDEEPCDSCRQDSRLPNWKWRGPDGQA